MFEAVTSRKYMLEGYNPAFEAETGVLVQRRGRYNHKQFIGRHRYIELGVDEKYYGLLYTVVDFKVSSAVMAWCVKRTVAGRN